MRSACSNNESMTKRLFIIAFALLAGLSAKAQMSQIAEAWFSMPDSVCPFFTQQQKAFVIMQASNSQNRAPITNKFDGQSFVDSISFSGNYIALRVAENMTWIMRVKDDVISIQQTVTAPRPSSFTLYYDKSWNLIRREHEPFVLEETDAERIDYSAIY